jgi:hypothetical protein
MIDEGGGGDFGSLAFRLGEMDGIVAFALR